MLALLCFQDAASAATREEEQAVSHVKLGPFTPKMYLGSQMKPQRCAHSLPCHDGPRRDTGLSAHLHERTNE